MFSGDEGRVARLWQPFWRPDAWYIQAAGRLRWPVRGRLRPVSVGAASQRMHARPFGINATSYARGAPPRHAVAAAPTSRGSTAVAVATTTVQWPPRAAPARAAKFKAFDIYKNPKNLEIAPVEDYVEECRRQRRYQQAEREKG